MIAEDWDIRHGRWKIHKHLLPDAKLSTQARENSSNTYNVVIRFLHDTLELNLTLGHQITPDHLPNIELEELMPPHDENAPILKKTKIVRKVLHWTLLKIEFTNPSKLMLTQLEDNEGEDVKLAHYLLLRSLTPSCLAERCPNTKYLEKTLRLVSKVVTKFIRQYTVSRGLFALTMEI